MAFFKWLDSIIPKLRWYDISLIKLSVFAFALLIAKFYPVLLTYDWTTYFVIMLLAAIHPLYIMFK